MAATRSASVAMSRMVALGLTPAPMMEAKQVYSECTRRLVLIIDDEPDVRRAIRLGLEEEADVIEASDGGYALELARLHPVDAVLLDLRLPGMDGLEALRQLRASRPAAKVVVVTALADAQTAVAAMKLGAVEYFTKPVNADEIVTVLRRIVRPATLVVTGDNRGRRAAVSVMLRALAHMPVLSVPLRDLCTGPATDLNGVVINLTGTIDFHRLLWTLPGRPSVSDGAEQVVHHVADHYRTATARSIAASVGVTPSYLTQVFRRDTGMGVKEYVSRVRVDVATYLLQETAEKHHTIAEDVGFYDASHLYRVFRQYTGEPPSVYRSRS